MPLAMNLLQVSVSCSQIFFKPDFISWMSSFIRENLGAERIFLRRFFFVEYSTFFCLVPFFEKASLMEKMDLRSSALMRIGFGRWLRRTTFCSKSRSLVLQRIKICFLLKSISSTRSQSAGLFLRMLRRTCSCNFCVAKAQ